MKYSNTIEYNINTKLDSSGLTKLQGQIKQLENSMQQMSNRNIINEEQVKNAKTQLEGLNSALTNSFNSSLGILDLSKFRAELDKSGVSATGLQSAFSMMGAEGQAALNGLTTQIANFNGGMERTSSQIDKIFTTFSNTFRWGLVSSFFSQFMNAIHSSVDYVKELDDSLTQIMLVTDYNRDSMNEFAKSANEAAKAVSMTTTGMTNASLIFAQQGYDLGQSQELATLSAKLANASQQDTATTSDQITAYMNAYGLQDSIEELTQQMDNWALIANVSAADVGELAQASQRAASMANAVGVSGEQLAAQIATIESVTREAPEQIGNGLKTLYARFSDIAAGKEDEDGFTLGKVTSQLNAIGVQVLNEMGQIRDVGDIMEDLMVIWDDLDQTSKVAASQALAGKYQVNRFMALMDNSSMYEEYKGATGSAATGTLDQMNEEFANSIEGRTAKLQASLEGLFSTIFNTDDIYPWMDAAQGAVDLLQQFFDALGGGKTVLLGITSLLGQVFSQNMARSINDMVANRNLGKIREQNINGVNDTLDKAGIDRTQGVGAYISATADQAKLKALNDAQYDSYMNNVQQWADASTALAKSEEELTNQINTVNMVFGKMGESSDSAILSSKGLNTYRAAESRAALSNQDVAKKLSEIDFSDVAGQAGVVAHQLKTLEEVFKESSKEGQQLDLILDQLAMSLDALADTQGYSTTRAEQMKEGLELLKEKITEDGKVTETSAKQLRSYTKEMENLKKTAATMTADQARKVVADAGDSAQKTKSDVDFNKVQVERAEQNALEGQAGIDSQQQIKSILDTMNAVQQLTFAWQAFQNLGSIWANEDLSKGEKVLQIIMNLTMAMPQLISAMESLRNTELFNVLGQGMTGIQQAFQSAVDKTDFGKGIIDAKEQLAELTAASEKGKAALEKISQVSFNEVTDELVEAAIEGEVADAALAKIGPTLTASATAGTGALGVLKGGLAAVGTAAKAALAEFWPFLLIGAAIAAVGFAIGQEAEKAKKAKEEALEAFDEAQSKLEQLQSLQEKIESFNTSFETRKSEGKDFEGLADEAREVTAALKEMGATEAAQAVHLATVKAEAKGTEEAYNALNEEIQKAQQNAKIEINNNNIEAAVEVLNTQKADYNEILKKQDELNDLKKELNNLEANDPGRKVIQDKIDALQDYIDKNQEAVNAVNAIRDAQAAIAGAKVDAGQGGTSTYLGLDDQTMRAGTYETFSGARDTYTMDRTFGNQVQGWDSLDDLERLDIMLKNVEDDASKASLEVTELLMQNQGVQEFGAGHYVGYQNQGEYVAGTQDYEAVMQQADWTNEQALKFVASLDGPMTLENFKQEVANLNAQVKEDGDLDVLLDARLTDETKEGLVKDQIAGYEPKDEDVDAADFQTVANSFLDNADQMGQEGTPFADYSEDLLQNADALEDVVEGILRYNDAVESMDKNMDNWKKGLADTNKYSEAHITAVQDLQETYADFLDLAEGMDVSEDFASNADNLKLMEDAANGVEGAYDNLAMAAAQDILIHTEGIEDLDAAKAALEGLATELPSLFEGVDVGGALDLSSVEQQINDLAKATGWSADQMAAYLNSIGINIDPNQFEPLVEGAENAAEGVGEAAQEAADAASMDVEADQVTSTDTATDEKQFTDAYPHVNPQGAQWSIDLPTFQGELANGVTPSTNTVTGWVPEITYSAMPKTATETKTDTSQATGYKYKAGQGATGKVKLKSGAQATRSGNSGGVKPSMGSRPSSTGGGGGGRKGGSCFVVGTLISTSLGFKPIEQIQKGDIVLSYNERIGFNEYSEVLQTMIHDTIEPIYTLHIKNEQLRVTGIHRFFITDKITCGVPQWVHAADLHVGQWVLFADGTWHVIHKIEVNIEHQTVYNFEVSHNHNYYVGRNQILAHNKGPSKKGGGKAKKIEPKEKKKHEKDYYEEVNSQLDKTEKILSKIEKEEDRLIGDEARANQAKQLKLLEKEITLNKEKLKIQKQELKDVDARIKKEDQLAEKTAKKGGVTAAIPNAVYDEDGVIQNYEQISKAIDRIHNKLIEKYNAAAAAGNEELAKQIEKTIQKFDKYGESLLKDAQRHNKLQSEIEGTVGELENLKDAIEDVRISAFKAHQEAMDNLTDLRKDAAEINTWFRDFDEDGFLTGWSLDTTPIDNMTEAMYNLDHTYGMTKEDAEDFYDTLIKQEKEKLKNTKDKDERAAIKSTIKYYQGEKKNIKPESLQNGELGMWLNDMDRLEGWINGTSKEKNPFGEDTATLWEVYENTYKHALQAFKNQKEEAKKLRDSIIDTWDAQNEALQDNLSQFDRISDHLERIGNTYALYYGEDSYDGILQIMDQQGSTLENQYAELKAAHKQWKEQYEEAVASGNEELIKKTRKLMDDAEDAMYDKAEELAEHWVERYEKAVDASIQKIDTKLWGTTGKDVNGNYTLGLEDQTMAWELQKDYMQTYKDDVEKAYEIDKLRSKYNNLLNDASGMSLQVQNKIRAQMQEQLDLLASQKTMSEYDVKLANAKLEILQKQIALEDAQRNKNKMQLRRDTQGNYRYVYRANEDDVQKAQDELNESQYDAYEMTKEQTIANNDRAISLYQDYMEKMREIANKYKDDQDARNAAMAALTTEYGKLLGALQEDFSDTTNGMYDILCWMVENSTEDTSAAAMKMLDQLYDKNGEVKENTGNDWRDFATKITEDVLPNIDKAVAEGIGNISNEAEDLRKKLVGDNGVMTDIGSSTKTLDDSMKKALETTTNWKKETENLFKAFTKDNKHVQEAMNKLKEMEKQLKTNQRATSELAKKYKKANQLLQEKTAESLNYKVKAGEEKVKVGDVYTLKKGTEIFYDNHGNTQKDKNGKFSYVLDKDVEVQIEADQSPAPLQWAMYPTDTKTWGKKLPESDGPETRLQQGWHLSDAALKKAIKANGKATETLQPIVNKAKMFDTGGYTGNWTDNTSEKKNGKLAFLHQKELILNAKDTENILNAVKYMRDLVSNQLQTTSLAGVLQKVTARSGDDVIEQRVEIQASFPNATDADDIRRALINLSDNAYQYSYRTR